MIVTVKISNDERTLKQRHLIIGADIKADRSDPTLCHLVEEAIKNFNGAQDDVQVIINMTW